jgi:hypothetical protein
MPQGLGKSTPVSQSLQLNDMASIMAANRTNLDSQQIKNMSNKNNQFPQRNSSGPGGSSFNINQGYLGKNYAHKELNSLLEADISDIDIELDDAHTNKSSDLYHNSGEPNKRLLTSHYLYNNFIEDSAEVAEVPFVHWSIYRQGIQNLVNQQGHKFQKNQKQLSKFLSQMFRNVLCTAIDKKILYAWMMKYNMNMYQSGIQWNNNQIKQAVFFQSAQMISSRSSSKSF